MSKNGGKKIKKQRNFKEKKIIVKSYFSGEIDVDSLLECVIRQIVTKLKK